jgi:hypothetical protein
VRALSAIRARAIYLVIDIEGPTVAGWMCDASVRSGGSMIVLKRPLVVGFGENAWRGL